MISIKCKKFVYVTWMFVMLFSPIFPLHLQSAQAAYIGNGSREFVQIDGGTAHTVALRANGTVAAWGFNGNGRSTVPAGLKDVVSIAAGAGHSLALKADGTVVAWGLNSGGQSTVPAELKDVVSIAAGGHHSLVLKADGTVVAWGLDDDGQSTVPADLKDVVSIAAGLLHSLAIKADGTVVAWGDNAYGQTDVPILEDVVSIAGGTGHSLALRADGTVVAWGFNQFGQSTVPSDLEDVIMIAVGNNHSLVLKADGTVDAWGRNNVGQTDVPVQLTDVVSIAGGSQHSLALKADGTIVAWGDNSSGQSTIPSELALPIKGNRIEAGANHSLVIKSDGTVVAWGHNYVGQAIVPVGLENVVGIAAGSTHSLALKTDGTVVGWGSNSVGQATAPGGLEGVVSVSAGESHSLALQANGKVVAWGHNIYDQADVPGGLDNVVSISAGSLHSLALKADGTVVGWGFNNRGQTDVPILENVVAIAAGSLHSLALQADGTVVAWGANHDGQTNVPVDLKDVVAISAGSLHSLALQADGTVVVWGSNNFGQLSVPLELENVVAIAAGNIHSLALKADGTVVAWGDNNVGQTTVPGNDNLSTISVQEGVYKEPFQPNVTSYTHYYKGTAQNNVHLTATLATPDYSAMYVNNELLPSGSTTAISVAGAISDIDVLVRVEPYLKPGKTYTITLVDDSTAPEVQFSTNGRATAATTAASAVIVSDTLSGIDAASLKYAWTQSIVVPSSGWTSFSDGDTLSQASGDGNWYLHIQAADKVGNVVNKVSNPFVLDNTAPTAVVSTSAGGTVNAPFPITITFSEAVQGFTDNDMVIENGTVSGLATVNSVTYRAMVNPTTSGQAVKVTLAAETVTDIAGIPNLQSNTLQVQYDTTKPVATFGHFTSGQRFNVPPAAVTVSVAEAVYWIAGGAELDAANALPLISIKKDGAAFADFTASFDANVHTFTLSFNSALHDGEYEVEVAGNVVRNGYHNILDAARASFIVDQMPPATPILTTPTNGQWMNNRIPTISGTAEVGTTVTIKLDGNAVATVTADASGSWSWTPPAELADGSHTVSASATDAAGNTGSFTVEHSFTVDMQPPVITLLGDASMFLTVGTPFVDPGATVTDLEESIPVTTADRVDYQTPGTYMLQYDAQDSAGNAAVPVKRTVHVSARSTGGTGGGSGPQSSNADLKQLTVTVNGNELKLSPTSDAGTTSYRATTSAAEISINVTPSDAKATITLGGVALVGGKTIALTKGDNVFELIVKAENGTIKTYSLTIHRQTELTPTLPVEEPACTFGDIKGHWAEQHICEAAEKGIVKGNSATEFEPQGLVTRVEFATMLFRTLGVTPESAAGKLSFTDQEQIPAWATASVSAAVKIGMLQGYPDGSLRPMQTVSRSEMAAMIARAMEWEIEQGKMTSFADDAEIPNWAKGYIYVAAQQGLLNGREGNQFSPSAPATRAEAATTLLRLWHALDDMLSESGD